jgi:hypothetical protein
MANEKLMTLQIKFLTTFKIKNEENKRLIQEEPLLTLHEYKSHNQ